MRRSLVPAFMSAPVTVGLAIALVGASLTAVVARELTAAPEARATTQLSQQVGFNGRAWTVTQPDAQGVRYIGGDFNSFNAWQTGNGAWASLATGAVDPTFPAVSGEVYDAAPDGQGGWVVAGSITSLGATGRNRVARLDASGNVVAGFVPGSINHEVNTIAVVGGAVLIGGLFTSVDGQVRNRVAALDLNTGALLPWDPNANSSVFEINVINNTIYIGGEFSAMSGQPRTRGAAFRADARTSPATGTCIDNFAAADCLTAFAPALSGLDDHSGIFDFEDYGGQLYIGGRFTITSGATTITGLARVDAGTGALDVTWDPALSGNITLGANPGGPRVYAIEEASGVLYVGGKFTSAGGQARLSLAAYDLANGGALTSWAPTATPGGTYNSNNNVELGGGVNALQIVGSTVYVAGGFFRLNDSARNRLGALDITTGATTAFNPHPCDWTNGVASQVRTISVVGSRAFFGGNFPCAGGLPRFYAAAVGPDGILTGWAPQFNGAVTSLSSDGTTVYAVGKFTLTNGVARQFASAVQTDGTLTSWNPTLSTGACGGGEKQEVLQTADAVYVGGCFTTVGGQARPRLAKTDRTTGAVDLNFNANPGTGWIYALAEAGSRLYVGGYFSTMGGQNRSWIAAVDKATGAVDLGWDAGPIVEAHGAAVRQAIYDIEPSSDDTRLYIGGFFGTINGQAQRFLAALDKSTGALDTSWRPVVAPQSCSGWDCGLMSVDQYDDTVYIGGASGNPVNGTAFGAVSAIDGSVSTWMNNSGTGEIRGITANDATAFIAGSFSSVAGSARGNTAAIDLRGPVLDPWPMNAAEAAPLTVAITAPDDTTSGAVVSNPGGINCGGTCEYAYPTTQTVTLQAVPKPAADFAGWTGACTGFATSCTVAMSSARSAIASFAPAGSVVTPSPTPSASASATPSPSVSATPTPTAAPTPTPTPTPTAVPGPGVPTTPRPPGPPTSVSASVSGTQATVEWEPPTDQGSAPVTSYRVVATPGDHTCITTTTSCTVDGLEPGTAYTFAVTALNSVDWGAPSEQSSPVVAPLLEIKAGARTIEGKKDRIVVTGNVVGLAPGTVLTPYVKLGNERAEAVGRARVIVREGGEITWRRLVRPFRLVTVHFKAGDVRSNSVSWQRIR